MKHYIINSNGFIEYKTGYATYGEMNNLRVEYCDKETFEFLKKYGQGTTVFNASNYQKFKQLQLCAWFVRIALQNGATTTRDVIERLAKEDIFKDRNLNILEEYKDVKK